MSLTVQQLIADAKKLSTRLMDRDQSADQLISRGQDVLKEVEAMRQYQENIENLNEIAHQRPRAHLVLGIQQENRHIRSLQQENKELRAALEEHQAALELIMSKYREHISRMIKSTGKIEYNPDNLSKQLHEKTMKVYEMAAVMKEAVKRDEEMDGQERELIARLYTENKGLRELLEISQRSRSNPSERKAPVKKTEAGVQTEDDLRGHLGDRVDVEVTLPMPAPPPRHNRGLATHSSNDKGETGKKREAGDPDDNTSASSPVSAAESDTASQSASESDETSDDDSVKFDTIKLRRKNSSSKVPASVKSPGASNSPASADRPAATSPASADRPAATSPASADKSASFSQAPTSPVAASPKPVSLESSDCSIPTNSSASDSTASENCITWNHQAESADKQNLQNSVVHNEHSHSPNLSYNRPTSSSKSSSPRPGDTLSAEEEEDLNTINNNSGGSRSATSPVLSSNSKSSPVLTYSEQNSLTAASPDSLSDATGDDVIEAVEINDATDSESSTTTAAVTNCESIIYDIITESVANSAR